MNDEIVQEKVKAQDILVEIDNLKKYIGGLASNVNSDQLEAYIDIMDRDITKLQDETENFYNTKYDKEINNKTN